MRGHVDLDPEQQQAIMRLVKEKEVALFAKLGSGKTVMALYAIKRLIELGEIKKPTLIVAPIRVVYSTWRQEAKLWDYTKNLSFTTLHGPEKAGRFRRNTHIHLINYEGLLWLADRVRQYVHETKRFPYDAVIFDESSKMKSSKVKRFKKWKMLMPYFKARYILTATPRPNHLSDLWSQFYLLDQGKLLNPAFGKFQMTYMLAVAKYKWVPKDGAEEIINKIIAPKTIYLKGKKYTPDPHYNQIKIEFTPELRAQYKTLEKEFFIMLEEEGVEAFNMASLAMKLRQFVQGSMYGGEPGDKDRKVLHVHDLKIEALEELVEGDQDRGILCAIQFRYELKMIRKKWPKAPVIYGGVSPEESDILIRRWNTGNIPLLVCHPQSMSHGLNLQYGGHTVVWLGLTWSLEQYQQLIGRLDRRGQIEQVVVHLITANQTTDEAIFQALRSKAKSQNELLEHLEAYWKAKK